MQQSEEGVETVPVFQAFQSFFHPLLVVLHHVRVHVDVVAADVPLRAPVWDGPEAEWRIMLVWFLELRGDTEGWEESGRRKNQQSETQEFPSGPSSSGFDGTVISSSTGRIRDRFDPLSLVFC